MRLIRTHVGSALLIAAWIALPAAEAQVYYVAPTGSDTGGDGSAISPWATISKAAKTVSVTGGRIVVRDGTYQGNVSVQRKFTGLLVISAEHAYRAKLRNTDSQTVSLWEAANVVLTGFDIARGTCPSAGPLIARIARSESIALINNILHDSCSNDVLKLSESPRNVLIMGNAFSNQQGSSGQHIDVNGASQVTIRDNIFFNSTSGTGVNGNETHGFVVAKNSGAMPESRDIRIVNNVFLNYEGNTGSNFILLGEDGWPFHEVQAVAIENNLMLGNAGNRMRAPLGLKGARDVTFRNNTVTGDLPSSAYAFRMNREAANPRNRDIRFWNNIWSDPTGTMGNFSDGYRDESVGVALDNNLYWNSGRVVAAGSAYGYADDLSHLIANPLLPALGGVVLPRWTGTQFQSGKKTVREEFERLATAYGVPHIAGAAIGRSKPGTSPAVDLLDRLRGPAPDSGAIENGAAAAPLRVVLPWEKVAGAATHTMNQVVLAQPAGPGGVTVRLSSSNPSLVQVPSSVNFPAGGFFESFAIKAASVTGPREVLIRAETGSWVREARLTLTPLAIDAVNLGPDEVKGGLSSTHNLVWLNGATATGGTVLLASSRPDLVTVPGSVAVAAGKSYSAYFNVTTKPVSTKTLVTIKAAWGGSVANVGLTLNP